jgi:hypothetical protein
LQYFIANRRSNLYGELPGAGLLSTKAQRAAIPINKPMPHPIIDKTVESLCEQLSFWHRRFLDVFGSDGSCAARLVTQKTIMRIDEKILRI